MKIAIMSMQRVINNRTLLRAYVKKKKRTIESLGHSVKFVDLE